MRRFIAVILLATLFSCNKQEKIMEYHENGQLKMEGARIDNKKTGVWNHYDSLGIQMKRLTYIDDTLKLRESYQEGRQWYKQEMNGEGNKHGKTTFFHKNGRIKDISNFMNNRQLGEFISYYPDGTLRSKYTDLEHDETVEFYQYFPNGQLFVYAKNMANGEINFYDSLGNRTYDVLYKNSFPVDTLKDYSLEHQHP